MTIDEFLLARVREDDKDYRANWVERGWSKQFTTRLLSDGVAKREAVWWYTHDDHMVMEATIKAMAAVYSDHSDYRQEWA